MRIIYLDHNATTRVHPEVRCEMAPFLDERFGNPSSIHQAGRAARQAVEDARDQVASLVGAIRDELIFTSGGSEANQLAVRGAAEAARRRDPKRTRVLASRLEHPSVVGALERLAARQFLIEWLPVAEDGGLALEALSRRLGADVALVTVQLANHEIGRLQAIAPLARSAKESGALFHSDCVQALGKIPVDVAALGVDLASFSAHKIYGPKGVGALYLRSGVAFEAVSVGGSQERERRPGTENVPGVVGFGAAARLASVHGRDWAARTARLRDRLEAGLVAASGRRNGGDPRVPNTTNLSWRGTDGELLVESLDLVGVAASMGAACSSGSVEPSPVQLALGRSPESAREAVRFSLGWENSDEEIDRVLELLPPIVERVRRA